MRKTLLLLLLGIFLPLGFLAWAEIPKGTKCPVMTGSRAQERFWLDYQGRRLYFCCKSCVRSFKKHPEKYLKNLPPLQEALPAQG